MGRGREGDLVLDLPPRQRPRCELHQHVEQGPQVIPAAQLLGEGTGVAVSFQSTRGSQDGPTKVQNRGGSDSSGSQWFVAFHVITQSKGWYEQITQMAGGTKRVPERSLVQNPAVAIPARTVPGEKEKKAVHEKDDRRGVPSKQMPKNSLIIIYLPHKIFGSQTPLPKKIFKQNRSQQTAHIRHKTKNMGK